MKQQIEFLKTFLVRTRHHLKHFITIVGFAFLVAMLAAQAAAPPKTQPLVFRSDPSLTENFLNTVLNMNELFNIQMKEEK